MSKRRNSGNPLETPRHASSLGRHAGARSRTMSIVILVVAALVIVLGIAMGVNALRARTPSSRTTEPGTAGAPSSSVSAPASKSAVPSTDPGDITMGVNGDENTIVLKGEQYLEAGAHASEPTDGVLNDRIRTSGTVDTSTPGDYTITYSVSDSSGHVAHIDRTVHVVDSMDTQSGGVPVLMYHYVYSASAAPDHLDANYLLDSKLEEQLNYLSTNDFYYPSWQEVAAYVAGTHSLPRHSVVLTFDDGEEGFLRYGVPLLAKYKVPATSFIIASDADAAQKVTANANEFVQFQSHSYDMHRAGGTVGHGGRISAMTHDEIVDDLTRSAQIVGANQAFAYPFGDTTDDAKAAVRDAGFLCAFTTTYGRAKTGDDPMALPRVRVSAEESLASFEASVQ
ncbi:polysaccharide deacetylase family protein [Bifidobacterium callimiconis]|uniref:polysaccharide deacetylase family protein n=1 Tax=Bifidobacterium callimiconis TaxID=2306973 RepID=UPI001BDDB0FD|nr:polysaccharide deacetylase family protein [Bifidobacterium callimiconis]MBT1177803.1 polysaccharide deacetylase family protein [Bifidobacterium callimiconis]